MFAQLKNQKLIPETEAECLGVSNEHQYVYDYQNFSINLKYVDVQLKKEDPAQNK